MTENRSKALVEQALTELPQPYGEDVTDQVLGIIENNPPLLAEYHDIAEGFEDGTDSVNQNIGHFVKEVTGRRVLPGSVPCKRNDLAKTYTKLVE